MELQYSDSAKRRALQTLLSIEEALDQLIEWNKNIQSADDFVCSPTGTQLLAADAMLISAIGEGINTINSKLPDFLSSNFPEIPWREIVGMRNRIVHGYFDINAEIVIDTIRTGVPALQEVIKKAILIINSNIG
ncbi:MAG: DUF86 domain-containing protein [Muribaculaceae bacterium]|nr:DUF86 domain-containing protein [Muribaculaceae bacterium]